MEKRNEALIERGYACAIRDIFAMNGITDFEIIRMSGENGQELKLFEAMAGRPLNREDAILLSPFTESEIIDLIENSTTTKELEGFQSRQTKAGIRHYNVHYCSDDPICTETIDYPLPDHADTSSAFHSDYEEIVRDALLDNIAGITKWLNKGTEDFLEFRSIANNFIGSGMVCNDILIQKRRTRDVVVILWRKKAEAPDSAPDFVILTAYPDITDRAITAVPTGCDIRAALHETDAYRYGSEAERALMDQKALRGLLHCEKCPPPSET